MTSINIVRVCLGALICALNYTEIEMTEYLLAFPATADPNVTAASVMKIYVASEYENLTVNLLNSSNNVIQSVLLSTSKAFSEMVVPSEYIMSGSELSRKALRLSAAMEFKAQVFNSNTPPADGYLALPIDYLGRSYLVTSFCAYYGYCQVVLAAMIKKTIVTIILPSMSDPRDIVYCDKGVIKTPVNKKIHITMDALDVFQIESKEDLTGTIIVSSYDISVFVGGRNISSTQPGSNIVEQLLPKKHWGTEFVVKSKVSHMYSDVVHIQTREDNTELEMTDLLNVTVQNGDETVVQRLTDANNFFHIKASKPVQVVHYSQVLRSDNAVGVNPSMTLVQSFQHWSKSYLFNCIGGVNYTLITNRNESLVNRQVIWKTSLNAFSVSERNNVLYLTHQEPFGAILESCGMGGASMLLGIGMYSSGTSSTTTDTTLACIKSRMTPGDGIDNDCDGKIDDEDCTRENEIPVILVPIDDNKVNASTSLTEINVTGYDHLGFRLVSCGVFVVTFHGEGTNLYATAMLSTSFVMFSECKVNCDLITVYDVPENESRPPCNTNATFWFSWNDGNITYGSSTIGFTNRKVTFPFNTPVTKLSLSTMFDESQITLIFPRNDCIRLQPGSTNLPDVFGTEFLFFVPGEQALLSVMTLEDDTDIFALDLEHDSTVNCDESSTCPELYADWYGVEKKNVKSIIFHPGSGLYQVFATKDVFVTVTSRASLSEMNYTTYNIYPVDVLGNSYIVLAYCDGDVNKCSCQIATKSPAALQIALTNDLFPEMCSLGNTSLKEKFSKFHIEAYKRYDFKCDAGKNITGVRFFATCNIAVFCGQYQQMTPVFTWGKEVYIPSIPQQLDIRYQMKLGFVTSIGGNVVNIKADNYSSYVPLRKVGSYGDVTIVPNQVYRIWSNHSICVALIMQSKFQPRFVSFTLITPAEQYLAKNAFISLDGTISFFHSGLSETLEMMTTNGFPVSTKVSINTSLYDGEKVSGLHFAIPQNTDAVLVIGTGTAFNDLANVEACKVIKQVTCMDGMDNDCDGLLDEEKCALGLAEYAEDYDMDGNFEEDCGCISPAPGSSPTPTVSLDIVCPPLPTPTYSNIAECWTESECPCSWLAQLNFSEEEKAVFTEKRIKELAEEMSVPTKDLSATARKLVSAKDTRPTAAAVGTIGVVFLAVVFGSILALDIQAIIRDLRILGASIRNLFVRD